jgi:hypothetical protein
MDGPKVHNYLKKDKIYSWNIGIKLLEDFVRMRIQKFTLELNLHLFFLIFYSSNINNNINTTSTSTFSSSNSTFNNSNNNNATNSNQVIQIRKVEVDMNKLLSALLIRPVIMLPLEGRE